MAGRISCIILTYNSRRHLERLLVSLREQTYQASELIIVDNASTDDTVAYLRQQRIQPIDQLMCNPTNEWFARGNNRGIHAAHGDYIFICNDDIALTPTWLERLMAYAESHPGCGMIGGKVLQLSSTHASPMIDSAGLLRRRSGRVVNRGENEHDHGQYNTAEAVFGITGAAMLMRRSALEAVRYREEYFDEDFVAYKEDVDLSWRMQRAGYTIWYEPSAVAYHARTVQHGSLRQRQRTTKQIRAYSYRNHIWTLVKNYSAAKLLQDALWLLPYECAKLAYVLAVEWSTARCLSQLVHGLPRMLKKR